jgi:hypothetical protein
MLLKRVSGRVLTIILVFLILSGISQMLIIWGEDLKGFPFSIFSNNNKTQSEQLLLGNLFVPSAIYMGRGLEQPRYMLDEGSFETVWNDTRRYLIQILKADKIMNAASYAYSPEEWKRVVPRRGFYVTFPFDIETEHLMCFLNCGVDESDIQGGIRAVAVLPWDNINPDMLNVFLRTATTIYRFTLGIEDLNERRLIYDIILKEYENADTTEYRYLSEIFPIEAFDFEINETLLISNDEDEKENSNVIIAVNSLKLQNGINDDGYVNEVAQKVSGGNEINYITSKNSENTVTLKNINNVYRYFEEGVLEYNYIPAVGEKPEVNYPVMISNVASTINSLMDMVDIEKIFLTNIRKESGMHIFAFDYIYEAKKVMIEMPYSDKSASRLVEITSNGVEVVGYKLVPLEIIATGTSISQRIDFVSLLDRLYMSVSDIDRFSLKSYQGTYLVKRFDENRQILPRWCTISFDNQRYYIDRAEK